MVKPCFIFHNFNLFLLFADMFNKTDIDRSQDPTSQSDFTTEIVHTSEVQAGHQCYSAPAAPSTVVAGTNATIQLEYTAQYNGSAYEIFYACADIVRILHLWYDML